jgi:hypothetical protein
VFEIDFNSTVFRWQGKSAWHFVALPPELSREIDKWCAEMKAGWGSVRVKAKIGSTAWTTSIFPDKARDTFLLPVKAEVRKAEGLSDGSRVDVELII